MESTNLNNTLGQTRNFLQIGIFVIIKIHSYTKKIVCGYRTKSTRQIQICRSSSRLLRPYVLFVHISIFLEDPFHGPCFAIFVTYCVLVCGSVAGRLMATRPARAGLLASETEKRVRTKFIVPVEGSKQSGRDNGVWKEKSLIIFLNTKMHGFFRS